MSISQCLFCDFWCKSTQHWTDLKIQWHCFHFICNMPSDRIYCTLIFLYNLIAYSNLIGMICYAIDIIKYWNFCNIDFDFRIDYIRKTQIKGWYTYNIYSNTKFCLRLLIYIRVYIPSICSLICMNSFNSNIFSIAAATLFANTYI